MRFPSRPTALRRLAAAAGLGSGLLCLGGWPSRILAQDTTRSAAQIANPRAPRSTEDLVRDARVFADRGDTVAALELLERATDQSPRDTEALYWRGLLLMQKASLNFSDAPERFIAARLLNRAADIDGSNPRYQLALGRLLLRSPLQRVQAERLFKRALGVAAASGDTAAVVEANRELGEVKRRRYLTGRDRRMYTGPNIFDPLQALVLPNYTREFLEQLSIPVLEAGNTDRYEAEEYFRQGLRFNSDDLRSLTALLDLLYDQKRYDEMLALVRSTLQQHPTGAVAASYRAYMAAGLAAFRLNKLAEADSNFTLAIARMLPADRAEFLDLGRILRKGDSVRVAGLPPDERARTDSAYWEAADPLLATPENEARLEFLSRMAYADLHYTDEDTRQAGWRTDRALILARYGEPPVIATFSPQVNIDARDALGRVMTVWYYPRAKLEFVFTGPPAFNYAYFAGNYRDHAQAQREVNPFALENLTVATRTDSIPVQVARFAGSRADSMEVVIAGDVPIGRLYADAPVDVGMLSVQLRSGPPGMLRMTDESTARVDVPASAPLHRRWTLQVPVRDTRLRLEAVDTDLDLAGARAQADLPALRTDSAVLARALVSSDLLLARRVANPASAGSRTARWNALGVQPLGALSIAPRDTFSLYWELYGLTPNAQQRLQYEIEVQVTVLSVDRGRDPMARFFGGVADLVGFSAVGEDKLALRFTREAPATPDNRRRLPELLTLGLGTSPSGRYRLTVNVTDQVSGRSTSTQREFSIARP